MSKENVVASTMNNKIEKMVVELVHEFTNMTCDQYEYMKAFCFSMIRSEASVYFYKKLFEIVDGKKPLLIEMK